MLNDSMCKKLSMYNLRNHHVSGLDIKLINYINYLQLRPYNQEAIYSKGNGRAEK